MTLNELIEKAKENGVDFDKEILCTNYDQIGEITSDSDVIFDEDNQIIIRNADVVDDDDDDDDFYDDDDYEPIKYDESKVDYKSLRKLLEDLVKNGWKGYDLSDSEDCEQLILDYMANIVEGSSLFNFLGLPQRANYDFESGDDNDNCYIFLDKVVKKLAAM